MKYLVSVVMPVYNARKFVFDAIDSILNQTYAELELIIVDDASVDGTIDLINDHYKDEKRIVIEKNEVNQGPAISRNKGIALACGRFIAFCDSDDLWHSDKLSVQMAVMQESSAAICYSDYDVIDHAGIVIGHRRAVKDSLKYTDMLYANRVGNLTCVIDVHQTGKPYQPVCNHEDLAGLLSLMRLGHVACRAPGVLASYRIHENNITRGKWLSAYWHYKVLYHIEDLGMVAAFYYTIAGRVGLVIEKFMLPKVPAHKR